MRLLFIVYVALIVSGIALFTVIGLLHV